MKNRQAFRAIDLEDLSDLAVKVYNVLASNVNVILVLIIAMVYLRRTTPRGQRERA